MECLLEMSQFNNIVHNKSLVRLSSNVSLVVGVLVDLHTLVVVAVANTVVDHRHSGPRIVEAIWAIAVAAVVVDSRIVAAVVDSIVAVVVDNSVVAAESRIAVVVEDSRMAVAEEGSYYNPDRKDIEPEICSNGINPIEDRK